MTDRLTYEAKCIADGHKVPAKVECPNCGRDCRPFEIVDVNDTPEIEADDACTQCLFNVIRERMATAEAEAKALPQSWDSDEGQEAKAERNRRLEASMWAITPGTPLSQECQDAFTEYRQKLHRLTVDFETPGAIVWPDQPTLVYF